MKICLLSPYHTGSHRVWAEGYARTSSHEVTLVTMPGSFWQWRLSGGSVSLAEQVESLVAESGPPDVLLVTSMVDVAGLRGLLPASLRLIPIALYMHENQITYPPLGRNRTDRNYGLTSWTSLLAADAVAFNSEYHLRSLLEALPAFLGEFPDERQHGRIESVVAKAAVLPVGCDLEDLACGPKDDPPLILWNHRWDADKDPASFFRVVRILAAGDREFRLALLGERFVNQRRDLEEVVREVEDRVTIDAHLPRAAYSEVVADATIVVSTAQQEFFGISVVEAMHGGAFPVLPDRLVYRERVPDGLAGGCLYRTESEAVELLDRALADPDETRHIGESLRATTAQYAWAEVAPRYDAWLASISVEDP